MQSRFQALSPFVQNPLQSNVDDVVLFQTQVQVLLSVGVSLQWAGDNFYIEVTLEHWSPSKINHLLP